MKIAFLFSGQGAQYPGMMKDLYETFQEVHTILIKQMNACQEILARCVFMVRRKNSI